MGKDETSFKKNVANDTNLKNELFKHVDTKESIAKYIWYLLTGGLVTSASYNYIVNAGCEYSVSELQQRDKAYMKSLKEKAKKDNAEERVYKTYE